MNRGIFWTIKEEEKLVSLIEQNKSLTEIAQEHKRTIGGIMARIKLIATKMYKNGETIENIKKKLKYVTNFDIDKISNNDNNTIYVLQCENNKYYIGKTKRPINDRLMEHFHNIGSEFTKKYKPVSVVTILHNMDNFDEDKITKQYMKLYGIDNVRGGTYCKLILPKYQIQSLMDEINHVKGVCYRCGELGHYVDKCESKSENNEVKRESYIKMIYRKIWSLLFGNKMDINSKHQN